MPPRRSSATRSLIASNRRGTSETSRPSSSQRRTSGTSVRSGAREKARIDVLGAASVDDSARGRRGAEDRQRAARPRRPAERVGVEEADGPQAVLGVLLQPPGDMRADGAGAHDQRRLGDPPRADDVLGGDRADAARADGRWGERPEVAENRELEAVAADVHRNPRPPWRPSRSLATGPTPSRMFTRIRRSYSPRTGAVATSSGKEAVTASAAGPLIVSARAASSATRSVAGRTRASRGRRRGWS